MSDTSLDDQRLWYMGLWLEVYSLIVISTLVGTTSPVRLSWRWLGALAALFGYTLLAIGLFASQGPPLPRTFAFCTSAAVIWAYLNVFRRTLLPRGWGWLRWATVAMLGVSGALFTYKPGVSENEKHTQLDKQGVELGIEKRDQFLDGLKFATAICAGSSSVVIYLLKRMNRKPALHRVVPEGINSIITECPGCHFRQTTPLGESSCGQCGLQFSIGIHEPRCQACGYLLYGLNSDRCPECATVINKPNSGAPVDKCAT